MSGKNPPITEYLYQKASSLHIPLSGTFELSPVCNFSCKMCYVRKSREEVACSPRQAMGLRDWLSLARQAREEGLLYLLLTGGEPLLWPDFWTLYDELSNMGFLISINTNGSLIDDAAIAHFVKKPPQKLNITLYGAGDETYRSLCGVGGVFSKVSRAIEDLCSAGIDVKLNYSVTPQNVHDLDKIVTFAKERDLVLAVATYMFPPVRRESGGDFARLTPEEAANAQLRYLRLDRGEEAFQNYLRAIVDGYVQPAGLEEGCVDPVDGRIRCRAGKASFWVTWDGWLLSCGLLPEPKMDLKQMDFAVAWKDLAASCGQLRLSGLCDKCPDRDICHPCAAVSYAETGSAAGIPQYFCQATQALQRTAKEILAAQA